MTQLFVIKSEDVQETIVGREEAVERYKELEDDEEDLTLFLVGNLTKYRSNSD